MAEGSRMWAISLLTIMLLLPLLSAAPIDIAGDNKKEDVKADKDGMHSHDENVTRGGKLFGHNQFDVGNINISGSVAGDVVSIGHQVKIEVHGHTHDHHHHEDDTVIECKEGVRELFKSIDSDKNGLMDVNELLRVCHQNNIQITESLVVRILTLPDKTVGFNMAKFCELLKDCQSTNSADVIYFLLQPYDQGIIVDGGWSAWSSWSDCTGTCGEETRTRTRACSSPAGGKSCPGAATEAESCGLPSCEVAGCSRDEIEKLCWCPRDYDPVCAGGRLYNNLCLHECAKMEAECADVQAIPQVGDIAECVDPSTKGIVNREAIKEFKMTLLDIENELSNLVNSRRKREGLAFTEEQLLLLNSIVKGSKYLDIECSNDDGQCHVEKIEGFIEESKSSFTAVKEAGSVSSGFLEQFILERGKFDKIADVAGKVQEKTAVKRPPQGIEEDVPANIAEAGEFPTVLLEPPVPILPIVPIMPGLSGKVADDDIEFEIECHSKNSKWTGVKQLYSSAGVFNEQSWEACGTKCTNNDDCQMWRFIESTGLCKNYAELETGSAKTTVGDDITGRTGCPATDKFADVEIVKVGDGEVHQSNRMGVYVRTNQEIQGHSVYEQKIQKMDEKQFLFVGPSGNWRVGPNIESWVGTGLKNELRTSTPPKTGWQYWDGQWIDDTSIQIHEVSELTECHSKNSKWTGVKQLYSSAGVFNEQSWEACGTKCTNNDDCQMWRFIESTGLCKNYAELETGSAKTTVGDDITGRTGCPATGGSDTRRNLEEEEEEEEEECVADEEISGSPCMCGDGNCEEGSTCVEGETCTPPDCVADQKILRSSCMCGDVNCEEGSTCVDGKTCTPECDDDTVISGSDCMCYGEECGVICSEGNTCVDGTCNCEEGKKISGRISGRNCVCGDTVCSEGSTCDDGTCTPEDTCEKDKKISGSDCTCNGESCAVGSICVKGETCTLVCTPGETISAACWCTSVYGVMENGKCLDECEADTKIETECMCSGERCGVYHKCACGATCAPEGITCIEGESCETDSCDVGTICEKSTNEEPLTDEIIEIRKEVCMRMHSDVKCITPRNKKNPDNVRNVEEIVSESKFKELFPDLKDDAYTYKKFLKAIGKYPSICKEKAKCKKVLATMFGHFQQETGGLSKLEEDSSTRTDYCEESIGGVGESYPCQDGKQYYGRGAKQLSWNYNYGAFSNAMFGTPMYLLKNPELVAETWLNFASAMWFYITPQSPKPSIQAVVEGEWEPSTDDKDKGFGTTIMIINGDYECGSKATNPEKACSRGEHYKTHAANLELDISGETISCANMESFTNDNQANLYWDKDYSKENSCKAVWWQTQFQALVEGDRGRCVEGTLKTTDDVPESCQP